MENWEYIDNYFSQPPDPIRKKEFEKRVTEDARFAEEAAFYLSALQVAKDTAAEERKNRFAEIYQSENTNNKVKRIQKPWPYVAAAAVLLGIIIGGYLFVRPPLAERIAEQYIRDNFQELGVTMSNNPDSLQYGLQLFNDGKWTEALEKFESVIRTDQMNFTAKKYAGIVSLKLLLYDKALMYFEQLEKHPGLHANPGKFYRAVAYLKRDNAEDISIAKKLLQQVVDLNLEGKETAAKWLKQL